MWVIDGNPLPLPSENKTIVFFCDLLCIQRLFGFYFF